MRGFWWRASVSAQRAAKQATRACATALFKKTCWRFHVESLAAARRTALRAPRRAAGAQTIRTPIARRTLARRNIKALAVQERDACAEGVGLVCEANLAHVLAALIRLEQTLLFAII